MTAAPFVADVHLPLSGAGAAVALHANDFLTSRLLDNAIDFHTKHTPHITLYLTEWQCSVPPCAQHLDDTLTPTLHDLSWQELCTVKIGSPYAAGSFAMLNVTISSCLQLYSDSIVNATYSMAQPNQSVPAWVHSLPEPERSEKIHDVRMYGSPNVFGQFEPHVTIGWSSNTTALAEAVAALAVSPASFIGSVVALGTTGEHGTVLKDKDLAIFDLSLGPGDPCTMTHADQKSCDADRVTFGGCVWCDIVDRPPFCSTSLNARTLPHDPPHRCDSRAR